MRWVWPWKEGQGGPGMGRALVHSPKTFANLCSNKAVTLIRESHRNALTSRSR